MKYFNTFYLLLFLLVSCAKNLNEVNPDGPILSVEEPFKELNEETIKNDLKTNLSEDNIRSIDSISDIYSLNDNGINIKKKKTPGWVTVEETRIFSNSVSPDNARLELLEILRNKAVALKIPETIEISTLLTDIIVDNGNSQYEQTGWSGFFKSTLIGIITEEKILFENLINLPRKNSYEKTLKFKAYIEPVNGNRDPAFYMEANIQNNLLKTGEILKFSIKPSKDCFVYIFNFMEHRNAQLIFPNEYMTNNFIKADKIFHVPNPSISEYVSFSVNSLPGRELTTESVYVVCTKEEVMLSDDLPKISTTVASNLNNDSFLNIQKWLIKIPLNQRTEKNIIYHIFN